MATNSGNAAPGTPLSLWSATASVRRVSYPILDTDLRADVAIVGGGYMGLSSALHLAEAGRSVVVLEAEDIGYGASGRNGGQANPGLRVTEAQLVQRFGERGRGLFRLGEEATDFLADLVHRKGLSCSFVRPGLIRLAHSDKALAGLEAFHKGATARGIATRMLSRDETSEMVGHVRYVGGLFDPRGGSVHPLDLAREIARVACDAGTRIFTRSQVTALVPGGGGWVAHSQRGAVTARQVIVATNGYSDGLVSGLARSLLPVNSFQIATAPLCSAAARRILPGGHAAYDSRRLVLYFRKSPDGRVILGGRASFSSARAHGSAGDYRVLERVVRGIFPALAVVPITHRWTGLVCLTPDSMPHYHVPAPGLHVVVGFNGRGVALAHRAGAWMARKLTGAIDSGGIPETPVSPIPLHAFRAPAANAVMRWHYAMDWLGY